MKRYGLIGYSLGHSFSERYFAEKFRKEGIAGCSYDNMPLENIGSLPELIASRPGLCGFNVTIPYKEAILPYLTGIDPLAAEIGAVNCVKIEGGELTGYNTDAYGFRRALLEFLKGQRPRALVLGSGGVSKAVTFVLKELGMEYLMVSRSQTAGHITYEEVNSAKIYDYPLIINTTPVGTFPDINSCPDIPYEAISTRNFLYDMIYNPPLTFFLERGQSQGARIVNGSGMLAYQAEKSWEIWNGRP